MSNLLFWDTSALVKVYVNEQGTPNAIGALKRTRRQSLLSEFVALEVRAALAKNLRSGVLDKRRYRTSLGTFDTAYPTAFGAVEVQRGIRDHASDLAGKHRMLKVGAMDVLHLATALHVHASARPFRVVLACSDEGLADAARREGLDVYDPQTEPLSALLTMLR